MQVRAVSTLSDYLAVLEKDPSENTALLKDMLIGVTNFFRDKDAFDTLECEIIPELFKQRDTKKEIRAWVAACSTSEEAYSLAILLAEQAALIEPAPQIQIFASDVDDNAVKIARAGLYPGAIITDVSRERLRDFFVKDGNTYRIRQFVRDNILFASHNLLRDPPFSSLDMISCRNLLIYLNRDVQVRLLKMFHFALKPDGLLFLGSSESAEAVADYFIPIDKKARIYRARALPRSSRVAQPLEGLIVPTPLLVTEKRMEKRQFSYAEVHQRALSELASPSVIIDRKLNILHMSKQAGRFLRLDGGEPSWNIIALVLPELRLDLRTVIYQAEQHGSSVSSHEILIQRDDHLMAVTITAKTFEDDEAGDKFILIIFDENEPVQYDTDKIQAVTREELVLAQLEAELQRNREQLQDTIEYAEVSTEELRASNEELQAINEELRSTTEELETSREELQSVNEELTTVNYELKTKVEETTKANDDLNNLIASTEIATIFVDRALRIKRFTPRASDIFNIIAADVGRSLLDLTHILQYDELASDVAITLDTLAPLEREVRGAREAYYIVRLRPYRTDEDKIKGVVMTFIDISARRQAEELVQSSEERMRLVAESTKDYAIITLDSEGLVTSWNKGAERVFGYEESEMLGQSGDIIFTPEDRQVGIPDEERRRARQEGRAEDERWHLRKNGSRFYCSGVLTPLRDNDSFTGYAKIARDQTERVKHDHQREIALTNEQVSRCNAETASALKDEFLAIMSHELRHPLNMIQINVELLSRIPAVTASPASEKAVSVIRSSVLSQAKIIEDLLDISRLNTGKLTLNLSEIDFCQVVKSIVEVAMADPASNDLFISIEGVDSDLRISADVVRIEQVVLNLLSNTIKFTPPGGVIIIRLSREGAEARLDVIDNGRGIEAEALPYLFDTFGQGGPATNRAKSGLGIGLALVRQITELHGGRVQARSDGSGLGAQFSIWFPLAITANRKEEVSSSGCEILRGLKILLVDDAQDMVMLFKDLLEIEGARVFTAINAADGLAILLQEGIDLLISDISMPEMDGYEFIRQVRLQPQFAKLPSIAASGLGRGNDVSLAIEAGFSAHICKPISIDQLCLKISMLLAPNYV